MKSIKLMNKISAAGTDLFDRNEYAVGEDIENPDAIMVRSAKLHDMEFGDNLKAIARAGAGVNNIPVDRFAEQGIVVFNTPGANANGVKELFIAALLLSARDIIGGVEWAKTLKGDPDAAKAVEKGKSQFAGTEVKGKTLGVIGLGAIGRLVANIGVRLGMDVVGYDPYISVEGAWGISRSVKKASSFDAVYEASDYLTIHVPSTPETKGMINKDTISKMKDGVKIINLARADLVDSAAVIESTETGKIAKYVTDFPTEDILDRKNIIAIPHLGASTEESEENCAQMAAVQLIEFLKNGNIMNSVNYPNCSMAHSGDVRLCVMHKNIPNMISTITSVLSEKGTNINNLLNRSRGEYAYSIIEIDGEVPAGAKEKLADVEGIIKVTEY